VLCVVGAIIGFELALSRHHGFARGLVRSAGCVTGVLLLVRAIVVEVLLVMGPALNDTVGPVHRFWTLALWNPWFAVGGISFLVASLGYRTKKGSTSVSECTAA